jgi:hypothetical protein
MSTSTINNQSINNLNKSVMNKNNKITFGETTFEFSYNKEKTFEYDGKGTMEVEVYDVLINGRNSIYYIQYYTKFESYELRSMRLDRFGGYEMENLLEIDGTGFPTRFPIDVVCDIIKTIDTNFVR